MSKISIIIPNWNGEERLKINLPKILEVKGVSEIIVVDDASIDGSVKLLEESFPQIILIKKERNSGFSSTVNLGVKNAKGDLVFLLNSDAIPEVDCLNNVLPHFKNDQVFSVGFNSGGSWSWAKFEDGYFWHYQSNDKPTEVHQTLWVSGGGGVFRKDRWENLGGLDELFDPFYEEDLDIGYRATKRGYINLWEPRAKVEHKKDKGVIKQNFSQNKIDQIAQRNQLIFTWKNITSEDLIKSHMLSLSSRILKNPKYFLIFLKAFLKLNEIKKKREIEINNQKITDEEILNKY